MFVSMCWLEHFWLVRLYRAPCTFERDIKNRPFPEVRKEEAESTETEEGGFQYKYSSDAPPCFIGAQCRPPEGMPPPLAVF